jgi:sugar transferase (PEP-CTERM/EpsH1 system associated)
MKILFLSTWFPYPPDQGSKIRAYYLLKALAERHDVTLVSYEDVDLRPEWREHIAALCSRVETLPRKPFSAGRLRRWAGLLSSKPSAVVGMYSKPMDALVRRTAREEHPDTIVALTFVTAPYALRAPARRRVVDIDNFMARMLEEEAQRPGPRPARLRRWLAYRKFLSYERELYPRFDLSLAVTGEDRRQVIGALGLRPSQVVVTPNGVDVQRNRPGLAEPQTDTLVYTGALTYQANYDAAAYFLQDIFPRVRAQRPQARLRITGRTDGVDLSGLPLDGQVELTGYLDDIRPVVAGSSVAVIPLRIGGGTRLKVLEAMALGTPVVSTPKGIEGLDLRPGEHVLVGETPADFADAVSWLLEHPEQRAQMAASAAAHVQARYDWECIGAEFCRNVEIATYG